MHLVHAGAGEHAVVDRALYLPRSWTEDAPRRRTPAPPDDVESATKPALAGTTSGRALDSGAPAGWVAGDKVYGADPLREVWTCCRGRRGYLR